MKDLATIMEDIKSGRETDPVLTMMSQRYHRAVDDAQNCSNNIKQLEAQLKQEQGRLQQCVGRCNEVASIMLEHANGPHPAGGEGAGETPPPPIPLKPGGGKNVERTKT